jgi:hypothetical protein
MSRTNLCQKPMYDRIKYSAHRCTPLRKAEHLTMDNTEKFLHNPISTENYASMLGHCDICVYPRCRMNQSTSALTAFESHGSVL